MKKPFLTLAALCAALFFSAPLLADEVKRSITQVAGDLYRFQNNFHVSVFLVTPKGVIATDPINADAARWLKAEIKERFGKEVRYLVYSHDHADHIGGGEVFADTATIVAHERAREAILGEKRPTAAPNVVFRDRMEIELGGKRVELHFLGRAHSDNLIVMRFPAERALFAVDLVAINRLPYKDLPDAYIPEWIETLARIEQLDFDILIPGHGPNGDKGDVAAHRGYLAELHRAVLAGVRAGRSLEELQQSITLDRYKEWGQYEAWRALNIEGMYRQVSLHRRDN